jgi:hypothetical protein
MSEIVEELRTAHLDYDLRDGFVGDWLVLGPVTFPLAEQMAHYSVEARREIVQQYVAGVGEISQLPAERTTCLVPEDTASVGGMGGETKPVEAMWRVVNTLEDHSVDLAHSVQMPHFLCAWSYAQVILPSPVATIIKMVVASAVRVLINGEEVFVSDELPDRPTRVTFDATLAEGRNEILIRLANVGQGDLPLMVALQMVGVAEGMVALPTLLSPVARRQKLARGMEMAYLSQDVYALRQRIVLRWPLELSHMDALNVRMQTPAGRIYAEANPIIKSGAKVDLGEASRYPDGVYEVLLQPQFDEYYVQNLRVQRRIPLRVQNQKWSTLYYGTAEERRQEALTDAARRSGDLFGEIAKSALGKWESLRREVVDQALGLVAQRAVGSERLLLALLGWVARLGDQPDFPQDVGEALEENAPTVLDSVDIHKGIVLATCHLLAGQFYPQRSFADNQMGLSHQGGAEESVLGWLHATAQTGLPEGESEQGVADALLALSHLVDLAVSDEVAEMAAVVLDKLAYQLALQSFLGVWGGSQDQARTEWLPSGRLGPLSGVLRLLWGQGAYNSESSTYVALACTENYSLPELIAAVGLDRQQEGWVRRQDMRTPDLYSHLTPPSVNRAAYRTGDYLLASMQGDWPAGGAALLWQVTMGPDAIIFGNRAACSSDHAAWHSSYWRGNAAPTRVAQWQDALMILYGELNGEAEGMALDFTHAYFPQALFDETRFENGWALARKENGYVAMRATGGVELVTRGRTAYREVRAAAQAAWLVQMGRAATDGSFAQFAEKVLAQPLTLETDYVRCQTLRGQLVEVGINSQLFVDQAPQNLINFPHIESIYGGVGELAATSLDIRYQEHHLRLDFGASADMSARLSTL